MKSLDPRILAPPASGFSYCSVFALLEVLDDKMVKAWDLAQQRECCILGIEWEGHKMTILDLQLIDPDLNMFGSTAKTRFFSVDRSPKCFSEMIIELCAGSGAMGVGPTFTGAKVVASVDVNPLACRHLRMNNHGTVLECPLHAPDLVWELHCQVNGAATFLLGFPCQPFSTQGQQLMQLDPRAQTFWQALRVIFLLQGQALLTECVPSAANDAAVRDGLCSLAEHMGWSFQEVNLKLEHQWPCVRHRWWTLSMPLEWEGPALVSWLRSYDHAVIGRVLPHWGAYRESDEDDLMLSQEEYEKYMDPSYGRDSRVLFPSKICPTILHSYSNVFRACPCGCRADPMSDLALQSKGLRGVVVQSDRTGMPRFLHPKEVAVLLTVPLTMAFVHPPRAALCLLGQVAAPLQSLWVYLHLINSAATFVPDMILLDPEHVITKYKEVLLSQVRDLFPFSSPCKTLNIQMFHRDGPPVQLMSCWGSTTAQLAKAEAISLDWGETIKFATLEGQALELNQTLLSEEQAVHVSIAGKRQCVDKPEGMLMIAIHLPDECATSFVTPGSFLFQAIWEHNLDTRSLFVDRAGKLHTADYRIWGSKLLYLLHDQRFPTIDDKFGHLALPTAFQHEQAGGSLPGLDNHAMWAAMRDIQDNVMCLLLPPVHITPDWDGIATLDFHGNLGDADALFIAFQANGHWGLLNGMLRGDMIHWTYFDGLRHSLIPQAKFLAKHPMKRLGLTVATWRCATWIQQQDDHTCGTVAIGHMALCLGLRGQFSQQAIAQLHGLLICRNHKTSWFSGFGPADLQARLAALLATKGVPTDAAASRASLAIQRLGVAEIEEALKQSNAWQALKGLTNRPGRNFQFVLKTELQAVIDAKAADRHGASIATKKPKEKKVSKKDSLNQWHLDPKLLQLDVTHFTDEMEEPVPQIDLSQVTADARGVALCTVSEAIPYINEPKNISTEALALLILEDVPADRRAKANITSMRFPVTFLPTKDPLLVNGCILQLGDTEVQRKVEKDVAAMDVSNTAVIKIQIFRDEFGGNWADVAAAPIRALIVAAPILKLCTNLQCNMKCGAFHAAVEDPMDQVIHEIWSRKFQDHAGRTCPAVKAELFVAFMRIAEPAQDAILRLQLDGVYFEPRADGPRTTNSDFSVIWLPGASKDAAIHKLKLLSAGLSLVRLKQRYGIRVPADQEKLAYQELRPGDTYTKVDVVYIFRAHPLPHGIQRAQVTKMLAEWAWSAKPLQPAKGSQIGSSWDIGASTPPPNSVMRAFGEDVLLTLIKDKTVEAPVQGVIGPKRVQHKISKSQPSSSSSGQDPWWNTSPGTPAEDDPWGGWKGTQSSATITPATKKRFDALATQLKTDLTENMNSQMASANTAQLSEQQESRLKKLEVGLHELCAQGKQFSQWFQETGSRITAQDQQLAQVQNGLAQQQADLQAVRTEVHTSADNLHQAMAASFGNMKTEIASEISFQHCQSAGSL